MKIHHSLRSAAVVIALFLTVISSATTIVASSFPTEGGTLYNCERTIPSDGRIVACPDVPPGTYEITCSGTWSHAAWVSGAISDCAYSGEPNASWGRACATHPGGAPYGGHGIRINEKQPFHANVTTGDWDIAYVDVQANAIMASTDVSCDWDTHSYNASFECSAVACSLSFRISDGVNPRDYFDNRGALSIVVQSTF